MSRTVTPSTRFLMMFTRAVVYSTVPITSRSLFAAPDAMCDQRNQAEDDRADARRDEVVDLEARYEPRRQLEHDPVQDDQKKPEGQDRQRQSEDEKDRLHDRIEQPQNQRRDGRRRPGTGVKSGNELHQQEQRECVDEPAKKEMAHNHLSMTSIFRIASSFMNRSGGIHRSCGSAPFDVVCPRAIMSATIAAGNAVVRIIALSPLAGS